MCEKHCLCEKHWLSSGWGKRKTFCHLNERHWFWYNTWKEKYLYYKVGGMSSVVQCMNGALQSVLRLKLISCHKSPKEGLPWPNQGNINMDFFHKLPQFICLTWMIYTFLNIFSVWKEMPYLPNILNAPKHELEHFLFFVFHDDIRWPTFYFLSCSNQLCHNIFERIFGRFN